MKKTKIVAAITAICMLVSVFAAFGCVNASADTANVSLYFAELTFSKYGMSTRDIYVKTDGNSSNQAVTVHYHYYMNSWVDEEAELFTTLSDGSKIWKASIRSYATEYAIKYEANGHTYWDNNNGNNYKQDVLGTAPVTVERSWYPYYNGSNTLRVALQNYAYQKNVFVRYTNDGWNTYTDAPLSYYETNENGTETWTGSVVRTAEDWHDFEYCVCYQVNGQEYWANNFGENYTISHRVYP